MDEWKFNIVILWVTVCIQVVNGQYDASFVTEWYFWFIFFFVMLLIVAGIIIVVNLTSKGGRKSRLTKLSACFVRKSESKELNRRPNEVEVISNRPVTPLAAGVEQSDTMGPKRALSGHNDALRDDQESTHTGHLPPLGGVSGIKRYPIQDFRETGKIIPRNKVVPHSELSDNSESSRNGIFENRRKTIERPISGPKKPSSKNDDYVKSPVKKGFYIDSSQSNDSDTGEMFDSRMPSSLISQKRYHDVQLVGKDEDFRQKRVSSPCSDRSESSSDVEIPSNDAAGTNTMTRPYLNASNLQLSHVLQVREIPPQGSQTSLSNQSVEIPDDTAYRMHAPGEINSMTSSLSSSQHSLQDFTKHRDQQNRPEINLSEGMQDTGLLDYNEKKTGKIHTTLHSMSSSECSLQNTKGQLIGDHQRIPELYLRHESRHRDSDVTSALAPPEEPQHYSRVIDFQNLEEGLNENSASESDTSMQRSELDKSAMIFQPERQDGMADTVMAMELDQRSGSRSGSARSGSGSDSGTLMSDSVA